MSQNREIVLGLPAREADNGSEVSRSNRNSRSRSRSFVYKRSSDKVDDDKLSRPDLPSSSREPSPKRARTEVEKETDPVNGSKVIGDKEDNETGSFSGHRPSSNKSPYSWNFAHTHNCPIVEDKHNTAVVLRHFKSRGCAIPPLREMQDKIGYSEVLEAFGLAIAAFHRYVAVAESRRPSSQDSGRAVENLASMLKTAQDRETIHTTKIQQLDVEVSNSKVKISELESSLQKEREARETAINFAVESATKKVAARHRDSFARLKAKLEKREGDAILDNQVIEAEARLDVIRQMRDGGLNLDEEEARLKGLLSDLELDISMAEVSNFNSDQIEGDQDSLDVLDVEPLTTISSDSARRADA